VAQVDKRSMLLLLIEKREERFVYACVFLAFLPEPIDPRVWVILIRVGQKIRSHDNNLTFLSVGRKYSTNAV